ncbi:LysR family transcriptional regulator [Claveliimonas bilis]|uniref:LysR family transcriptional regulator n=1 Tax=Claveliimonas bilis TaxID=3028070 RepID=A0ABM8IA77_9FIRM|nr:LysR family transcriptional regulator [Claveliimonas bilis]BDZ78200.1 LysR family transcriptional regulator [Claveliimonas bilis]
MQLQQMRYVLAAAEKNSFSAAAKSLFISQPSLSQQIGNLEKELGIPLFIRHSKSVTLTDAGEQFVIQAQRILNRVDQLSDTMKKYSLQQSGTLRIGMLWIAGYLGLSSVITDYHKRYPHITYHLKVEGSNTLLKMLSSREIDAAFVISTDNILAEEDLYYQQLMDDRYMVILSAQNPLSSKSSLTIQDLKEEKIIMPAKASAFRQNMEQLFAQNNISPNVLCETSQSDLVMQLASQGLAVGFASRSIARKLQNPACRILPLKPRISRPIYYVTLKELLDYPPIRSFTSFVESYPLFTNAHTADKK